MIHELGATVLVDLSSDRVRSGRFLAGELVHGPCGFVERGREVEIGIGIHLKKTDDGGVGDGGGAVEDSSEVLGLPLRNSHLLVRVTLNLLGLARPLSVQHLAQPLLHKAATTVEGGFVVVCGAGDVGFVQAVLVGEQVSDGGVVAIESVLILAMCATEDTQLRRLDCVSQLTLSVLHGGVLVSGG
ncbi:hypothetical protein SprV_0802645200 [Sparganum proliferum]